MEFPQYRKLSNDRSYFKIVSANEFIEIQRIGSKFILHHIVADKYPEILRIKQMIHYELDFVLESNQSEYNSVSEQIVG